MYTFTDTYLGYLLARCSHQVSASFHERLKAEGINVVTWRVLCSIKDQPLSVNEVARRVLLEQSTLSKALDRLERDGLLTRERDESNRRKVNVLISQKGTDLIDHIIPIANEYEENAFGDILPEQKEELKGLLRELIQQTN